MSDRDSITQALMGQWDPAAMSDTRRTMQYPPLDAASLIAGGSMRAVQHPGEKARDPNLYSLVTPYNDTRPGSETPAWPNKPAAYSAAQADLAVPNSPALYDGKYRQLQWAQNRGSAAP